MTAKELILQQLRKNKDSYLSGSKLSSLLGMTRAAIWKHVTAMRKEGFSIEAKNKAGYKLIAEPRLLDIHLLDKHNIIYLNEADSTNIVAGKLPYNPNDRFRVVAAEKQTHGRGRMGKAWSSQPGCGLWFSILYHPLNMSPTDAIPITLATAAVLAGELRSITGISSIELKWPNDLLIKDKKFGGILTELKGEAEKVSSIIVGIGLNINHQKFEFPADIREIATSLFIESSFCYNRTEMLIALTNSLKSAYADFNENGFSLYRNRWKSFSSTLGKEVIVTQVDGKLQGQAVDITGEGMLILEDLKGNKHNIRQGEVAVLAED